MKLVPSAVLAAILALLAGCASMKVTTETPAKFDFDSIATYEWIKAPEKILNEDDTILDENLHQLLNNELSGRGWKQVLESDRADIQVVYYIKLSEHEEYTASPSQEDSRVMGGFTYNNDRGGWDPNDHAPDLNVYTVEVGTLTLLLHDTRTDELVWRGTLKTKIDRGASIEKQKRMLSKVANKIVEKIPR